MEKIIFTVFIKNIYLCPQLKKTGAILFLLIYLFTATEFAQMLKLPVLWQHYKEHKQSNTAVSFVSFLQMHYFNGDIKDADYERDMKLPFKTHSQNHLSDITSIVPRITSEIQIPVYNHFKTIIPADDNGLNSTYLSAVWQPPKA